MTETLDRVGKNLSSAERWEEIASDYASKLKTPYHLRRLEVINSLMPEVKDQNIIDFGCGEGTMVTNLIHAGAKKVYALDPNEYLLKVCKEKNSLSNCIIGGVEKLKDFENNSIDLIIAANVIGYLTDQEEKLFYEEAQRIVKKDGNIVLSFSNELFDLFTFNKYTVDFYKRYFDTDISGLITNSNKPNRNAVNIRENPINYPHKVKGYSFTAEKIEYINFHKQPPLISCNDPDNLDMPREDTLNFSDKDKWKLMFQCSTFTARLVRD